MSRKLLSQLVAVAVLFLVGLYYILFDAIGLPRRASAYQISVVLPAGGNIYSSAYVTYRGVEVGRVSSLHLQRTDVVADLAIDSGVKIPSDVSAHVKELTAAAEQYLELVPPAKDPSRIRYLRPGQQIPESRTTIPVSIATLLTTVDKLVRSLHASDLNVIANQLAVGFEGVGQDLHQLIADSKVLLEALQQSEQGQAQAIDAGHTVLQTFNGTAGDFASFTRNLELFTHALARSNSDLVTFLKNGSGAGAALEQFLQEDSRSLAGFLNSFAPAVGLAYAREPAIKALFQILPVFSTDIAATSTDGHINFELLFNDQDTVCPYTSQMLEPTSLVATADLTRTCGIQAPDLLQRGADKAPAPAGG